MLTSIRYVLLCAIRDKLFLGLIAGVVIAAFIGSTLGGTALLEEKEMMLAYAGAASRLILNVGLIVFVCFHIRSSFDSREIDVMLSHPISRTQLAVAYWLGFAAIATLLVIPTALTLAVIGPLDVSGYIVWNASLLLELWLTVALALFAALALRSAVSSVMATLGFYVLSRMMAFFILSSDSFAVKTGLLALCKYLLQAISVIVPRLDFFSKTEWLVYGVGAPQEIMYVVLQAAIFVPLLVVASIIDFQRKQF